MDSSTTGSGMDMADMAMVMADMADMVDLADTSADIDGLNPPPADRLSGERFVIPCRGMIPSSRGCVSAGHRGTFTHPKPQVAEKVHSRNFFLVYSNPLINGKMPLFFSTGVPGQMHRAREPRSG